MIAKKYYKKNKPTKTPQKKHPNATELNEAIKHQDYDQVEKICNDIPNNEELHENSFLLFLNNFPHRVALFHNTKDINARNDKMRVELLRTIVRCSGKITNKTLEAIDGANWGSALDQYKAKMLAKKGMAKTHGNQSTAKLVNRDSPVLSKSKSDQNEKSNTAKDVKPTTNNPHVKK